MKTYWVPVDMIFAKDSEEDQQDPLSFTRDVEVVLKRDLDKFILATALDIKGPNQ